MRSAHIVAVLMGMAPARPLPPREGESRGDGHRPRRVRTAHHPSAPLARSVRGVDDGRAGTAARAAEGGRR